LSEEGIENGKRFQGREKASVDATPAVEEGMTTTHVKRNARTSSDHLTGTSGHRKRFDEPDRLTGWFPKLAASLNTGSLVPKQSSVRNGAFLPFDVLPSRVGGSSQPSTGYLA